MDPVGQARKLRHRRRRLDLPAPATSRRPGARISRGAVYWATSCRDGEAGATRCAPHRSANSAPARARCARAVARSGARVPDSDCGSPPRPCARHTSTGRSAVRCRSARPRAHRIGCARIEIDIALRTPRTLTTAQLPAPGGRWCRRDAWARSPGLRPTVAASSPWSSPGSV